ncbi:hypothetical protein C8Q74DRAFT_1261299 [Fomes fomentarius]|nr:hypothetical protein C8Q74DRAFT_1261299 [Fomes fomentarius]
MEAQLVGSTLPLNQTRSTYVNQVANSALTGALVMHVFAAIMSFFSAFFLIRYKLALAKQVNKDVEKGASEGSAQHAGGQNARSSSHSPPMDPGLPAIFSSNPHLEQVGPFRRGQPPTQLLDHCHSLCMWLAAIGFVLAMAGVVCFAWSRLALSSAIFASGCMGVCLLTSLAAFFWPASSGHGKR